MSTHQSLEIVADTKRASVLLDPIRLKLLSLLAEPGSASRAAERAGIGRQIANYHLRELEKHGFLELVEERKRGSVTERVLRASAASYAVARQALASLAASPERISDRFSLDYLATLAERIVGEVGELMVGQGAASRRVPSMSVESAVKFRSPDDRSAFARELSAEVSRLTHKYHAEDADSETYRFVLVAHPIPRP